MYLSGRSKKDTFVDSVIDPGDKVAARNDTLIAQNLSMREKPWRIGAITLSKYPGFGHFWSNNFVVLHCRRKVPFYSNIVNCVWV